MSSSEYINLFPENDNMDYNGFTDDIYTKDNGSQKQYYSDVNNSFDNDYKKTDYFRKSEGPRYHEEEPFYDTERSTMTDYKRQQTGREGYYNGPRRMTKSGIAGIEEKAIWAVAIFVFFGVFVFLIGYWLGKTTINDVNGMKSQYTESAAKKLEQKKLENSLSSTANPAIDNPNLITTPIVTGPIENKPTVITQLIVKEEKAPVAAKPAAEKKTSNVKLSTSPKKEAPAAAVKANGDYTIQVSAHTTIDKARYIEEDLQANGFESYIVETTINGVTYYRVRAGRFGSKEAANAGLDKIKALQIGTDSFIVNLN